MHVGLCKHKRFVPNPDGLPPRFARKALERLRLDGKRSTRKCRNRIVPCPEIFLALQTLRSEPGIKALTLLAHSSTTKARSSICSTLDMIEKAYPGLPPERGSLLRVRSSHVIPLQILTPVSSQGTSKDTRPGSIAVASLHRRLREAVSGPP